MITAKSGFRPELESLRGLAALAVAGFHIGQSPTIIKGVATHLIPFGVAGGNDWQSPANLIFKVAFPGHASVLFFFVLSGFVLIASLERSTRSIPEAASVFLDLQNFQNLPGLDFRNMPNLQHFGLNRRIYGSCQTFRPASLSSIFCCYLFLLMGSVGHSKPNYWRYQLFFSHFSFCEISSGLSLC